MLGKLKDMLDLALGHNKKKVFLEEKKTHFVIESIEPYETT